jgi:hypothetical protein
MAKSGWKTAGLIAGVGCLSIIGVIVGGVVIAALYARATIRNLGDPTPQSVERRIALPPGPVAEPVKGQKASSTAARTVPLRVRLELQEGTFTIRPGEPGTDITVQGRYAPGLFELTESHSDGPSAREARVRFKSKISGWQRFFANIGSNGNNGPELTVTLPRGTPIDLTLQLTMGKSEIDLGGLTLGEVDLNASMGEHKIDFREPVVEAMRELRLNTSMGNVVFDHLGNARAETISGHGSMGNVTANLAGAWAPGSSTDLRFEQSMGDLTVRVPSNVKVDVDVRNNQGDQERQQQPTLKQPDDPNAPTLRLRVNSSMGNARVVQD